MADVAATIVSLATAAVQTTQFLINTINDIQDAPKQIRGLRGELDAILPFLERLKISPTNNDYVLEKIQPVLKDASVVCDELGQNLSRWTKRSPEGKLRWDTRIAIGIFKQGRIKAFKAQLTDCKTMLTFALTATFVLRDIPVAQVGSSAQPPTAAVPLSNPPFTTLDSLQDASDRTLVSAQKAAQSLQSTVAFFSEQDPDDDLDETEQDKSDVLEALERQRASNETLQALCKHLLAAASKRSQRITNVSADHNARLHAGIFNSPEPTLLASQDLSNLKADNGAFVLLGQAWNLDLGNPGRR